MIASLAVKSLPALRTWPFSASSFPSHNLSISVFTHNMAEIVMSTFYSANLDALSGSYVSFPNLASNLSLVCFQAFAPLNLGGLK